MADDNSIVWIGDRHEWGAEKPFGIETGDRRHHLYVVGKTGSGKTTLLRNLLLQDIEAGRGVGLIDPHGDLASELLDFIPPRRADDVVYFDPADREFPIGLNFFRFASFENWHLVASGIVGAMKAIWRDSWGPRLEYILYATVAALLHCDNASFLGIPRMLADGRYRAWVVKQVKDPVVRSFWTDEFSNYDRRFLTEAIAPVQNKVGQLLMPPLTRHVLGQVRNKVDFRFMMDNRRIFIANLSKGRLGEDKANLLGALLVTTFQLAAMSRSGVSEHGRQDFHLYVDEFHNFSTESFATLLAEARKYRLCLTLSHQYLNQLREEVRDAVFGNVGSMVAFRVGSHDAEILESEFGKVYSAAQFTGLSNYEICAKLLVNGQHGEAFMGRTFPPHGRRYGRGQNIAKRSREKYATKREIVESRINRWLQS
jgi:hypothetical protein